MASSAKEAAFVGLGAMGTHLARHLHTVSLAQLGKPALVWNRTPEKAQQHADENYEYYRRIHDFGKTLGLPNLAGEGVPSQ